MARNGLKFNKTDLAANVSGPCIFIYRSLPRRANKVMHGAEYNASRGYLQSYCTA